MPKVKQGEKINYVEQNYKVVDNNRVEDGLTTVEGVVLAVNEDSFLVSTPNPSVTLELSNRTYSKEQKLDTWHLVKPEDEAEPEKPAKAAKQESPAQ